MKYLSLSDFDEVANTLNFDTADCQVRGGCDLYTTKAASADKKLYRSIDHDLEAQYKSVVTFCAGLSAAQRQQASLSLNLSRASPFGPLSQISSRRTFAYLIATMNASHSDYDFSHLKPTDFRREKRIRPVMDKIDTELNSLRPKNGISDKIDSAIPQTPNGSETWNIRMWRLIDKGMTLKDCSIYRYEPEGDPYDDEEGSLWTFNYFFFNKAKKRVCYLYVRGRSMIDSNSTPRRMPGGPKRPGSGTWSFEEDASSKRAKFWLGVRVDDADMGYDEKHINKEDVLDQGKEPIYVPSDTDVEGDSPCKGRSRPTSSDSKSDVPSKGSGRRGSST